MPSPLQGTIDRNAQMLITLLTIPIIQHSVLIGQRTKSKQERIVRMDFNFKGRRACELLALEPQVVIEKHEEVDKSCFSTSDVEGYSPMYETLDAIWIFLSGHRQLNATFGLELLDRVDAIGQAVTFEKFLQGSTDIYANGRPGVVIHLRSKNV